MNVLFDGQTSWSDLAVAAGLTLGVAYLLADLVARLARVAVNSMLPGGGASLALPAIRQPVQTVRVVVFVLIVLVLVLPVLELVGVRLAIGPRAGAMASWVLESGVRIALIAVAAYVIVRMVSVAVQRFEYEISRGSGVDVLERAKRAKTLGTLIRNVLGVLVIGITGLMILHELRVDILPVLTGAGVVGLAVGFGAQALVRDIIAGFFLILENQVRVGDVAVINGTGGVVESINLRTIVLRDTEGTVHVFPNGAVTTLANRTREYSYYVLDIGVGYGEDTDRVVEVLREVGSELEGDPAFGPFILAPLEIFGVDDFQPSQVVIKSRIKTVPLKQWDVGRELRRRIKKAFDAREIELSFAQLAVYPAKDSRPWLIEQVPATQSNPGPPRADRD